MTTQKTPSSSPETSREGSTPPLREDIEKWRADLRTLADEVRVQIHLGELEAKDAWGRLEPKVFEFEQRAEAFKNELGAELKNVGKELKSAGQELKSAGQELKHAGQELKHVGKDIGKDLEHAGATLKSELIRLRDRLVKS